MTIAVFGKLEFPPGRIAEWLERHVDFARFDDWEDFKGTATAGSVAEQLERLRQLRFRRESEFLQLEVGARTVELRARLEPPSYQELRTVLATTFRLAAELGAQGGLDFVPETGTPPAGHRIRVADGSSTLERVAGRELAKLEKHPAIKAITAVPRRSGELAAAAAVAPTPAPAGGPEPGADLPTYALLGQGKYHDHANLDAGGVAAVGALVAQVAHELKNSVGIVLGYAQLLLRSPDTDPKSLPSLQAIQRQARRCADLASAMPELARESSTGRRPLVAKSIVARVYDLVREHASARGVRIEVAPVADDLPPLHVSAALVEGALLSIIENALDVTLPGGVVELGASAQREGVELTVRDRGPGIPPEVLPRIFDAFFSTKPRGQHSGLGLSLARQMVGYHGGQIHVDTTVGAGTNMRIWLPVAPHDNR